MPGAQPVPLPARVSPSNQVSVSQADEDMQPSKQKPRVPLVEKHLVDQLSKEEQDALNSKSQEATEADKKVYYVIFSPFSFYFCFSLSLLSVRT